MISRLITDDMLREIFKEFMEYAYSFGGPVHTERFYYKDYPDYNALPRMAQSDIIKECHARWWKEHSGQNDGGNNDRGGSADLQ